jgi:hypothetical protein
MKKLSVAVPHAEFLSHLSGPWEKMTAWKSASS